MSLAVWIPVYSDRLYQLAWRALCGKYQDKVEIDQTGDGKISMGGFSKEFNRHTHINSTVAYQTSSALKYDAKRKKYPKAGVNKQNPQVDLIHRWTHSSKPWHRGCGCSHKPIRPRVYYCTCAVACLLHFCFAFPFVRARLNVACMLLVLCYK